VTAAERAQLAEDADYQASADAWGAFWDAANVANGLAWSAHDADPAERGRAADDADNAAFVAAARATVAARASTRAATRAAARLVRT